LAPLAVANMVSLCWGPRGRGQRTVRRTELQGARTVPHGPRGESACSAAVATRPGVTAPPRSYPTSDVVGCSTKS
jgi:hypothetical protein